MTKIYTPNKGYTGISAGVSFVNGEGETNDKWAIQWFRSNGYKVVEKRKPQAVKKDDKHRKIKKAN